MITIDVPPGAAHTPELLGAERLKKSILSLWPNAEADDDYQIVLIPSAFCTGQKRSEIDILLVASCPSDATFTPTEPFDIMDGRSIEPARVVVRSLMACIELKEQSAANVEFRGTKVWVKYKDSGWSGATDQSHEQTTSLSSFLRKQGLHPPFIRNAIWLANVHPHEHTVECKNVVLANLRWDTLLQAILADRPPHYSRDQQDFVVDDFNLLGERNFVCDLPSDILSVFTTRAQPSELDQPRLNRLSREQSAEAVRGSNLDGAVGNKLLLIRGAGGTGKTVLLLQLARHLYETQDARIVLLTYNRTLVADITRLLGLLHREHRGGDRTIAVQTVHSFLWEAAGQLCGVPDVVDERDFDTRYRESVAEMRQLLHGGVLTPEDIEEKKGTRDGVFFYDYVFVDEGQDFPDEERDVLVALFGHQHLVVSEGAGQLVRRASPTDWRGTLKRSDVLVHPCRTCLRMKSNVARFIRRFADALDIGVAPSVPEPNDAIPGGRVVIADGDYFAHPGLHDELESALRSARNVPMDQLFCVPSVLVTATGGERRSAVAEALTERGSTVWDAVNERRRGATPMNGEAYRVVTYESCRGLEGWTVVLCEADSFFDEKRTQARSGEAEEADRAAAQWLLMAMMRAMDTLVITLRPGPSPIRTALKSVEGVCRDFLEWRKTANG